MEPAGRDAEVAAVASALDALPRGSGRLILVSGEAGLGKSRLAAEAVSMARQRGVVAASGRRRETEGAPAF